ncbi:hypothetical protein RHSP_64842 [Rhizobium freirei PRF 81]|uniref:Uncharacterized protein n=1 Tax=Rhizobium freirei PRF 81 TaxID=363754 RepID=N6U7R1_9HYPH|nr:hypothetical protein RHSP_64842 [Rhizobium freirei PRF 81]
MRTARLEGHGEGLTRGVHHRIGHFEAHPVEAGKDFDADAGTCLRRGSGPGRSGFPRGGNQRFSVGGRIGNPERRTIGGNFRPDRTGCGMTGKSEGPVQSRFISPKPFILGRFTINLATRNFGIGRPKTTLARRGQSRFQRRPMSVEQGHHADFLPVYNLYN